MSNTPQPQAQMGQIDPEYIRLLIGHRQSQVERWKATADALDQVALAVARAVVDKVIPESLEPLGRALAGLAESYSQSTEFDIQTAETEIEGLEQQLQILVSPIVVPQFGGVRRN